MANPSQADADSIWEAGRRLRQQSVRAICYWSEIGAVTGPSRQAANIPLLHLGVQPSKHPGIWLDLAAGIREAVSYLHAQGHTKLGFYGPLASLQSPSLTTRLNLFRQTCLDHGFSEPAQVPFDGESWDVGAAAAGAVSASKIKVDAWVSFNDVAALGLLYGRGAGGKKTVFAFDGTALIRAFRPVVPHLDLQVAKCAKILAELAVSPGGTGKGKSTAISPLLAGF